MEKEIAKQFALILMEKRQDQYGNIQNSPVEEALNKFVIENKEKLLLEVIKVLSVEKIAETISGTLLEVAKGIYGSHYNREEIIKDLKEKVAVHLAKKISEDLKI